MSQQIFRLSELYTNPGHFPRSGATRWPWARPCRRRTRLAGRSGPPIRAKQKYHHGFYGLALLPCFLHAFRTLAPLCCHGPSYIDTRGDFVLLHLAVWHGSFSKHLVLIFARGRARKKVTERRRGASLLPFFRGEILVLSMSNSFWETAMPHQEGPPQCPRGRTPTAEIRILEHQCEHLSRSIGLLFDSFLSREWVASFDF